MTQLLYSRMKKVRPSFSLPEVLLVLIILAVLAGMSIPAYRNYQIRSDLDIAANQTEQMLNRARLLSQAGTEDSIWGVNAGSGLIFMGSDFTNRNRDFDEYYPYAPTIIFSGITEVYFSQIYGEPSETGIITLTALNGDTRTIAINSGLDGSDTIILPGEDVRMKIDFSLIKNNGSGNAEAAFFVGPDATRYKDGEWIPLITNNQSFTDNGVYVGSTGLAVERRNSYVRVMAHGDLDNGGKEVVDAYITFEGATVNRVENDLGDNECEQPFDGVSNTGVGGDEVTQPNERQVLFQTRVTNFGDSILIYWTQDPSRWL